ncbi:MAG: hypothetical protein LBS97_04305 [Treponema sp.]|jgi:hypothetical protein|nr:hypothetical protein [Treponema sp.]
MKKIISVLLLLALVFGSAFTQTSPSSAATGGRFLTDIDNFVSSTGYTGVTFDKWFAFGTLTAGGTIDFGFATRFANLYLGAYYAGNGLNGTKTDATSEKTDTAYDTSNGIVTNTDTTDTENGSNDVKTTSTYTVLVGVSNLAFKFTLADANSILTSVAPAGRTTIVEAGVWDNSPAATLDNTGLITHTPTAAGAYKVGAEVSEYNKKTGALTPTLELGFGSAITGLKIKPKVTLAVPINYNEESAEWTDYSGGSATIQKTEKINAGRAESYTRPSLAIDTGGWKSPSGISVGLIEKFEFDIYGNEYADGTAKGTVTWGEQISTDAADPGIVKTQSGTILDEKTFWNNTLTPYLSYSTTVDKLSLAARLDVPFSFGGNTSKKTTTTVQSTTGAPTETTTDYTETKTDTFGLGASSSLIRLRTGVKYQVIPGRFSVQGGVEFDLPYYAYSDVETTKDPAKTTTTPAPTPATYPAAKSTTTTTTKKGVWTSPTQATKPTIGWTFNFTPTVALDMQTTFDAGDKTLLDNFVTQAAFGLTKVAITAKF